MKWSQTTHTGLVRLNNEDAFLIEPALGLFAVADGLGGHRAGEVASHKALEQLPQFLGGAANPAVDLVTAMEAVNASLLAIANANRAWRGMGTTCTACLVRGRDLWVGHVGDSRAYLLRGGDVLQLTEDHTWVSELVKNGEMTGEEARRHPRRNMLVRALGVEAAVRVDLRYLGLVPGDRVLLCTDGLSDLVTPAETGAIVAGSPDLASGVGRLLAQALARGGPDNVTIVLLEVE